MAELSDALGPALGLIELCSIARGVLTCDAMLKAADVRLVHAGSTHPGKYTVLVRGGVLETELALNGGVRSAGDTLVDKVFLPNPHESLLAVLQGPLSPTIDAVGILETYSVASTIRGADAALKAAEVEPISIALAVDLGGKGYFMLTGALHDVQEAMSAGRAAVGEGLIAGFEIIARPHPDLHGSLR